MASAMTDDEISSIIPALQLRHAEGQDWRVVARWSDGRLEDIGRFKSELEANEWIAKHFQTWFEAKKKDNHDETS
jgi:hypothetical protein